MNTTTPPLLFSKRPRIVMISLHGKDPVLVLPRRLTQGRANRSVSGLRTGIFTDSWIHPLT